MPLGPGLCLRDMALLSPLIHKYYTHPEGHPSWNFPGHFMSTAPGASDSWDFLWSERAVSLVLFSLVWGNGPEQGYSDIKGSQNSARHSSFQHADHFFFKARADRCPKGDLVLMDSEIAAATGLNTSSSPLCCSRCCPSSAPEAQLHGSSSITDGHRKSPPPNKIPSRFHMSADANW